MIRTRPEKMRIFLILMLAFVLVLVIPEVHAVVSCDMISDQTFESGTSTTQQVSFQCTNSVSSPAVTLSKGGSASSYFDLDETVISQSTNTTQSVKTFTIDFDENAPDSNYVGLISFSDNSPPLTFLLQVTTPTSQTGCQINPSLVSYNQQIQQGTKVPIPKITFNPINCQGQLVLTASSVSIQGGIVTPLGQKPVFISQVESDGINIQIDTEGLVSQTYFSKLKISAFNKQFEIPFTIIVTGGTGSTGTFNVETLPSCSLTNTILNINSTYNLVCSGIAPDITVEPVIDNDYIKGVGVDPGTDKFVWSFEPKKFGNTFIRAQFKYLNVPVGDLYEQEVTIQSTSGQAPGTILILEYIPKIKFARPEEIVIIQVLDNKTRSLVQNSELYIDGILIINETGRSYKYQFQPGKNHSIRAVVTGYNNFVSTVKLSSKPISITIKPTEGVSQTNFNITTNSNATIFINGENKGTDYYGKLKVGTNRIQAFKEGFEDAEKNVSVKSNTQLFASGEFKKGITYTITINKNTTWTAYYQKDDSTPKETLLQGKGNKIQLEPQKKGVYIFEADDATMIREILGFDWNAKWWFLTWYYWVIGIAIIGIATFLIKNNGQNKESGGLNVGFKGTPQV